MAGSAGGAGILLSTLSGLNGNRPLAAKPALIFFGVNTLSPCGAIQSSKVLLADRIYTSLLESINLVTIGCLEWGKRCYITRLELVGGMQRKTT